MAGSLFVLDPHNLPSPVPGAQTGLHAADRGYLLVADRPEPGPSPRDTETSPGDVSSQRWDRLATQHSDGRAVIV
jgi:hypothetical protein